MVFWLVGSRQALNLRWLEVVRKGAETLPAKTQTHHVNGFAGAVTGVADEGKRIT